MYFLTCLFRLMVLRSLEQTRNRQDRPLLGKASAICPRLMLEQSLFQALQHPDYQLVVHSRFELRGHVGRASASGCRWLLTLAPHHPWLPRSSRARLHLSGLSDYRTRFADPLSRMWRRSLCHRYRLRLCESFCIGRRAQLLARARAMAESRTLVPTSLPFLKYSFLSCAS